MCTFYLSTCEGGVYHEYGFVAAQGAKLAAELAAGKQAETMSQLRKSAAVDSCGKDRSFTCQRSSARRGRPHRHRRGRHGPGGAAAHVSEEH